MAFTLHHNEVPHILAYLLKCWISSRTNMSFVYHDFKKLDP